MSASQCKFGLVCKLGRIPDAGGICTQRIAEEGQHCGGFIFNPPVCDSGLTCDFVGRNPDGGGICRTTPQLETRSVAAPNALRGEHCGSFKENAPKCQFGLVCKLGLIPDAGGICTERISEEGQHCGGFILNPSVCASGLTCHLGPVLDGGGICRKTPQVETRSVAASNKARFFKENSPKCQFGLVCKLASSLTLEVYALSAFAVGQPCGGNIFNPPVCESDLICDLNRIPEVGGICVAVPKI
ncbi:hypothetical protein BDK51DRAFT_28835 [Blyttiomyces helicus]|uniref:Uncharacterized protein n=1 Tax=Blyttiomyces helicus TaxID=388810 RepID=A0A4P9WRW5_9FUNG|nr:hypothetical protein BDK51DRAFT_28835 [Blyttiomyces helicus]|eukprot:RKO93686.1 hypothetical protein BDK51DRAFT_28835 [Blyttiomyces helicus]